jgi:hypothetical protein
LLVEDGHHEINGYCDPDLRPHGIGAGCEVMLDTQMPLDAFKKEFDLPSLLIKTDNGDGRYLQIVVEEGQLASLLCVEASHLAQGRGEALAFREVLWKRAKAREAQVVGGSYNEEGSRCGNTIEPSEVHITTIH